MMVLLGNGRTSRGTARGGPPPESAHNRDRESRQRAQRTRHIMVFSPRRSPPSPDGWESPPEIMKARSRFPARAASRKEQGRGRRERGHRKKSSLAVLRAAQVSTRTGPSGSSWGASSWLVAGVVPKTVDSRTI